ncbi:hypothetical protein [Archangium sp.]|uniref:hypothetical protein n=1 Tax=Archangium sp. TaxID=1872627 RepID=UPI00286CDD56|nr:hypothetical protein [Archangium sp.]
MRTCGGNRWWTQEAKLFIRRERGATELVLGGVCLLASVGLGLYVVWAEEWSPTLVLCVLGLFCLGLYNALGVWEVTLHAGRGRVFWAWGLGWPLFRRTRLLTAFDRVQVVTPEHRSGEPVQATDCMVQLAGEGGPPHLLAGSDDRDEALTLAEAVARHARLGLQVGGGRVRPYEELSSSAPGRTKVLSSPEVRPGSSAPGSARPLSSPDAREEATGATSALVEPPTPPPLGCRVQVREAEGRSEVLLPAPGWDGGFRSGAAVGVVMGVLGLVPWGVAVAVQASWGFFAFVTLVALAPLGACVVFMRRALVGVHTTWRLTVSRAGVEVVRAGVGAPQTTRIPAQHLRDVDVRELREGAPGVGLFQEASCPMLVLERQDGEYQAMGAGLPRQELEWAAARLRQALARAAEARRQLQEEGVRSRSAPK